MITGISIRFQSTHPSGVRRHDRDAGTRVGRISIHAPQWGATIVLRHQIVKITISIHAPQWGATYSAILPSIVSVLFQSTHPSGVRRGKQMTLQRAFISIHAPQWGATRHALIRYGLSIYFNPRTPVGCDMAHVRRRRILWISIHAPQWGATCSWS